MSYLKRELQDLEIITVNGAHGGNGDLHVAQLLGFQEGADFPGNKEDFQSPVNFVHRLILPAGSSIGMHQHTDTEEFYYIERGSVIMVTEKEEIEMKDHSIFLIKPDSSHEIINKSKEDAIIIVMEITLTK